MYECSLKRMWLDLFSHSHWMAPIIASNLHFQGNIYKVHKSTITHYVVGSVSAATFHPSSPLTPLGPAGKVITCSLYWPSMLSASESDYPEVNSQHSMRHRTNPQAKKIQHTRSVLLKDECCNHSILPDCHVRAKLYADLKYYSGLTGLSCTPSLYLNCVVCVYVHTHLNDY